MFSKGTIFGFGTPIDINVTFNDADSRKRVLIKKYDVDPEKRQRETLYLFTDGDNVQGLIVIATAPGKRVDFNELKCELIGEITIDNDSKQTTVFTSHEKILSGPGSFEDTKVFEYNFDNVSMPAESYTGISAFLRYYIRVTLSRSYVPNVVEEHDFWVQNTSQESEINNCIKMEVGIEDCLHIEFEYNKLKYHLNDVVLGKIFFLLVKIKIKHMEISIIQRETTGHGASVYNESEVVAKFEIMDGAPAKGESVPVRLFLGSFPLTPTYKHVLDKFSTKYYLNLVLIDEEDRRYYKQQEIVLWRKHL
uniref:Vacuolar protein sorting-associated protein 26 n=1 Tax=Eutreptiella gymnastica TaxID=73025 RepID=A0A7S1IAJ0_9EUGL|mmetsp:Transcript_142876/g.249201  ORF Transcript_142876/g.249201 Transcript_142876/m.249201 type:complete len:307 (+) Transcript_142876:85-1005(+)